MSNWLISKKRFSLAALFLKQYELVSKGSVAGDEPNHKNFLHFLALIVEEKNLARLVR